MLFLSPLRLTHMQIITNKKTCLKTILPTFPFYLCNTKILLLFCNQNFESWIFNFNLGAVWYWIVLNLHKQALNSRILNLLKTLLIYTIWNYQYPMEGRITPPHGIGMQSTHWVPLRGDQGWYMLVPRKNPKTLWLEYAWKNRILKVCI